MDRLKSAIGYGSQSGQEPISGETGEGTVNQPYDAGNVAGQSGAPASEVTSTNPTGTTQYDTGEAGQTSTTSQDNTQDTYDSKPSENLAAGVTSDNSTAPPDPRGNTRFDDTNAGAVSKGTDQSQGPDERVTSNQSGPASEENTTAQDTFFNNAGIKKDEKAAPSKFADEVTDKNPFTKSNSESRTDTTNDPSNEPPLSSTDDSTSGSGLDAVGSSAPEKGYKTADTEPHPQSSEVLSSATPGAALDSSYGSSQPQPQTTGNGYDQPSTTTDADRYETPSTTTGTSNYNNPSSATTDTTTSAAAADTDYPSPKTQPTESQGGFSGISHNTGSAPSAPDTGNQEALEDPALGASQGQGKKKIGDRIKEKLHIGKKEP
ncbi:MAG: hypothetical protein Q9179_000168 [Wetmoreana sp. 5 TL-2023]